MAKSAPSGEEELSFLSEKGPFSTDSIYFQISNFPNPHLFTSFLHRQFSQELNDHINDVVYPVSRATPSGRREYEVSISSSSFHILLFSFSLQGGGGIGGFEDMGFIRKSSHPVAVVISISLANDTFSALLFLY